VRPAQVAQAQPAARVAPAQPAAQGVAAVTDAGST
jgi:hypothetical protein